MSLTYPTLERDRVAYWQRQIDYAVSYYKKWFDACGVLRKQYDNEPANWLEQEKDDLWSDLMTPGNRVKANLIYGWIDQSVANAAAYDPAFAATPTNALGVGSERIVGGITNYWWRELAIGRQTKTCLLDGYLMPWAAVKIGYTVDRGRAMALADAAADYVFDDPEQESMYLLAGVPAAVMPEQDHKAYIESHTRRILQDPAVNLTPELEALVKANLKQRQAFLDRPNAARHTDIQYEAPFVQRWEPGRFLVDPLAADGIHDARWIAFEWEKPIDEVLSDSQYENTKGLEPTGRLANAPGKRPGAEMDDFGLVRGWEVWALDKPVSERRRADLMLTVAQGHDRFLRYDEEWPYEYIENYPAEVFSFQRSIGTWFNKPPLLLAGADSAQSLANEILDSYLSVVRKQKNIFLYDGSIFKEEEIQNLLQMPDMSMVDVPGLAEVKGKAIVPIEFGSVPPDKGDLLRIIESMFDRSAGTPQPTSSINPDSATEASNIEKRNTAREDDRNATYDQFQVNIARKVWQLTAEFRPARVFAVNPMAQDQTERFVTITREMARGEYNFTMAISSARNVRAVERKQLMEYLRLLMEITPALQQMYGAPPNLSYLLEQVTQRGFGIFETDQIFPWLAKGGQENLLPPEALPGAQGGGGNPLQRLGAGMAQTSALSPAPSDANVGANAQRPDLQG